MNNRNFYLFKGDWHKQLAQITGLVEMNKHRVLSVWTPKDKSKNYNLLVVHGAELPKEYCFEKTIWKTDDTVFESFYRQKARNYNVHVNCRFQEKVKESEGLFLERQFALVRA